MFTKNVYKAELDKIKLIFNAASEKHAKIDEEVKRTAKTYGTISDEYAAKTEKRQNEIHGDVAAQIKDVANTIGRKSN